MRLVLAGVVCRRHPNLVLRVSHNSIQTAGSGLVVVQSTRHGITNQVLKAPFFNMVNDPPMENSGLWAPSTQNAERPQFLVAS